MASSSSEVPPAAAINAQTFPDGASDYKPLRKSAPLPKVHVSETPMTWKNWYHHIDWLNTTFVLLVPLAGLGLTYWVPLQWKTLLWSIVYYFHTGLGITAGLSLTLCPPSGACWDFTDSLCRIPSSLGSYLLQGLDALEDLPRCSGSGRRSRLSQMVVSEASGSPQIYRHGERPLLRAEGSPLRAYGVDGFQAKRQAHRPNRHLRPQ
jgi:hypothetical protein